MRRRIGTLATIGLLTIALRAAEGGEEPGRTPRPRAVDRAGVIVPAYFYPAGRGRDDWARLADSARSVPMRVILNPASGPGRHRDPRYIEVLAPIREAGARVLGYVDSDYARRPMAAVEEDLRAFRRLYPIDGFFIDQMANAPADVAYYLSIRRLVREIDPRLEVVGNPGTSTLVDYLETADTLVTFEGSARGFAGYDPASAMPWAIGVPSRRFAAIVYDAADAPARRDALARASRSGAGSVYVTDQKLPNPYLGLPPYWSDEVATVRAIDRR